MEIIDLKALVNNDISEQENVKEVSNAIRENFIDYQRQQPVSSRSFYRKVENVTRDISIEPIDNSNNWANKCDLHPEMFWSKDGSLVQFDELNGYKERTKKTKENLKKKNSKDSSHNTVFYTLIFKARRKWNVSMIKIKYNKYLVGNY